MTRKNTSPLHSLIYLTQLGLSMIIPIIGGVLLGNFLDKRFSTGYLFLLLGVVVGVLAAFRNLFIVGDKLAKRKGKHRDGK